MKGCKSVKSLEKFFGFYKILRFNNSKKVPYSPVADRNLSVTERSGVEINFIPVSTHERSDLLSPSEARKFFFEIVTRNILFVTKTESNLESDSVLVVRFPGVRN